MPKAAFLNVTGEWDNLAVTVEANAVELAYLGETRTQLLSILDTAKAASVRQAALLAQYRQVTRDLEKLLSEGGDLATRIRNGIRMQYGLKAEKLTEFQMQPRRKRSRPRKEEPVPAPTPTPAPNSASNRP